MDINMIAAEFSRAEKVGDIFPIIANLIDYLIQFERELNDTLENLDSDNIKEIDFAMTRIKNLNLGGTADESVQG